MELALSTTKEALIAPLSFVAGAADFRGTIPMFGTALLKAVDGRLSLLCSDGSVLARKMADCTVKQAGEIAVDAKRFGDLVRSMPDKQAVSLEVAEGQLVVKAGRSRFKLPTHPAEDYPKMAVAETGTVSLQIGCKRLAEMLDEVALSMAVSDVRYALNATLLTLKDGALWAVATDGHRLTVSQQVIEGAAQIAPVESLIPRKSALLAKKLLGTCAPNEIATLVFAKNECRIQLADGTVLVTRCVDGKFPDWNRVIPQPPCVVHVEREHFMDALGMVRAAIESGNKMGPAQRSVRITFGKTVLSVSRADVATSEIEVDNPDSSNEEIALSVDYLTDAVSSLPDEEKSLRVRYESAAKAITVQPKERDYPLTVVMPLRD